jgi:o-succinylbenzoate synthase
MSLRASQFKKVFQFNFKARTSRGLMKDKTSWFIKISDESTEDVFGIGECGPLPGLSVDFVPDYEEKLEKIIADFNNANFSRPDLEQLYSLIPVTFPSIRFGFETALLDLENGGKRIIFQNDFLHGRKIPINGLIWMGDMDFMMGQISIKISEGFKCIKLKVGGMDFDRECDVLQYLRNRYFRENVLIRLDANGAFKLDQALFKLETLTKFGIHSIEQPIKAGLKELEEVCRKSPIPVALDEELIGKNTSAEKMQLLDWAKPKYIILKPMLHGGMAGCEEWIKLAEERSIGWWITSSLESNIGLNAICQFTANYQTDIHQGLGTGKIYDNNFESPLEVKDGFIFHHAKQKWNLEPEEDISFRSFPPQNPEAL